MDAPEYDVADAFKKPDRAAGLAGRLNARPARRRPDPTPDPPSSQPAESAISAAAGQRLAPRPSPRTAGSGSDRRLVLALPIELRNRARAHASSRGETYLDVVLTAVQEVHDQLPQLLDTHRQEDIPPSTGSGGLFEHQPQHRKAPKAAVQITIRGLSHHDRGVLEDLVESTGAANLTEMITVALEEHLPGHTGPDEGE